MPDPDLLVLIPTFLEARAILGEGAPVSDDPVEVEIGGLRARAALCGFGPAASGGLAAVAIAATRSRRVLLAGVAGGYRPDRLPLGGVLLASEVRTGDVGVGAGAAFRSAREVGFAQAPGRATEGPVHDRVPLAVPPGLLEETGGPVVRTGGLVTVAAMSGSPAEAALRASKGDDLLAEDMEGFSVAVASRRLGATAVVLRGISNLAGDLDRHRWRMNDALSAVRSLLPRLLSVSWPPSPSLVVASRSL